MSGTLYALFVPNMPHLIISYITILPFLIFIGSHCACCKNVGFRYPAISIITRSDPGGDCCPCWPSRDIKVMSYNLSGAVRPKLISSN